MATCVPGCKSSSRKSANMNADEIAAAIREAYPWLDEQKIQYYADLAIKNKEQK